MDQNMFDRIRDWVVHAGPAIDNLPPAAPLTSPAVEAFNNTMTALPVPAIDPLRILALIPQLNNGHALMVRAWVRDEAAIANDNSYYHVTEQQHGRGRFRMLPGNDFQGQQHALDAIRIVLRAARWIVNNPAEAGALAAAAAVDDLGVFPGAAAAMAAHNAAALQDHHEDAMDVRPDAPGPPSKGGRRSRRNRTQKRKKSRRSTSGRKRRRTRGAKHRKKSARRSTKRRMTKKSK